MYDYFKKITKKPRLFQEYTAKELWADPHISQQMLQYHLEPTHDIASRSGEKIDKLTSFLIDKFDIAKGKSVIDFGCGPGLYAKRLAQTGAKVHGIDFSKNSIEYARQDAKKCNLNINYECVNYLDYDAKEKFDLAMLVYYDLCALSPIQVQQLLKNISSGLKDRGSFIFDVLSIDAFEKRQEETIFGRNLMNGFWSADDYFGLKQTFLYQEKSVALDRYDIFSKGQIKTIYNWLEYYDLPKIEAVLRKAGFTIELEFVDKVDPSCDHLMIVACKE